VRDIIGVSTVKIMLNRENNKRKVLINVESEGYFRHILAIFERKNGVRRPKS